MNKRVRKAIFPVGGMGIRFLPATKAMPKEMLPVVDKPLIQYAVEEAKAAGMENVPLAIPVGFMKVTHLNECSRRHST